MISDNVLFQSVGFQALMLVYNPWEDWAAGALQSDHNTWYAMEGLPGFLVAVAPGQPSQRVYNQSSFGQFTKATGQDAHSLLSAPALAGLPRDASNLTGVPGCQPLAGSPVLGRGAVVDGIDTDFDGQLYGATPNIGAFQNVVGRRELE